MFGRNREYLDYTVRPSEQGKDILAEEALSRIIAVDGVDYLDGFKLSPNNQEPFEQGSLGMDTTQCESEFSNQQARDGNIRWIAAGSLPLFIHWEDVLLSRSHHPPRERLVKRAKGVLGRLLQKVAA